VTRKGYGRNLQNTIVISARLVLPKARKRKPDTESILQNIESILQNESPRM